MHTAYDLQALQIYIPFQLWSKRFMSRIWSIEYKATKKVTKKKEFGRKKSLKE
jgi:hypothetical protein